MQSIVASGRTHSDATRDTIIFLQRDVRMKQSIASVDGRIGLPRLWNSGANGV
jgi:hypothetical protein